MLISNVIGLPFAAPRKKMGIPVINLILNNNYSNTTGIWGDYSTMSVEHNICSNVGDGSYDWPRAYHETTNMVTDGHKYYVRGTVRTLSALTQDIRLRIGTNSEVINLDSTEIDAPIQNQWYTISDIYTWINGYNDETLLVFPSHSYSSNADANGATMQLKEIVCVDLTACFGSGKEPAQAWCDSNFPVYWYGTTEVNAPPAMPTPPQADPLRIWAKFDEGKYQALTNYASNGIWGQLGTTVGEDTNDPTWVQGGLQYIGDDIVLFPHQDFASEQLTYIIAVKFNDISHNPGLMGQLTEVETGPLMYMDNEGRPYWIGNNLWRPLTAFKTDIEKIYVFSVTHDGTYLIGYCDGVEEMRYEEEPEYVFVPDETAAFGIGGLVSPSGDIWGADDQLVYYAMVYDIALTGQEITDAYAYIQADLAARGVTL